MLKTFAAIITAAVIAGAFTLASAGNAEVDAGPIAKPAVSSVSPSTEAPNCVAQPWPYLSNCTGTPVGIRLVTTDRSAK